jgi:hypothetical protein
MRIKAMEAYQSSFFELPVKMWDIEAWPASPRR